MSRACRVQKTCGHAAPSPRPPAPPPCRRRPPSQRIYYALCEIRNSCARSREYLKQWAASCAFSALPVYALERGLAWRQSPVRPERGARERREGGGRGLHSRDNAGINHSIIGRCRVFVMTPRYCSFFSIYPRRR